MKKRNAIVSFDNSIPKIIPPWTKQILCWNGYFYKAVETKEHLFFCNYNEGDDNCNTLMFRKADMALVSDNYFASAELFEVLLDKTVEITFLSPTMKYNLQQLKG